MRQPNVIEKIAGLVMAIHNCEKNNNQEWLLRHKESLGSIEARYLPRGSGFDVGTVTVLDKSKNNVIVFRTSYHHMNDHGYYDGWTQHYITVKPSFLGVFDIQVSGSNKRDIKDYIKDVFIDSLSREVI